MSIQVETFAKHSDAPAQISPELVLVSPPDEARAAREALGEPSPKRSPASTAPARAEAVRRAASVEEEVAEAPLVVAPPSPRPAPPRVPPAATRPVPPAPAQRPRRSRWLLLATALVLGAAGFAVGRELGRHHDRSTPATRPATAVPASATAPTTAPARSSRTSSSTGAKPSTRPAGAARSAAVSWRPRPTVRHYRLDLLRGRAVVLTILTDEPRAKIPRTFPNAGRRSRLEPGVYQWRVRAATAGPSRVLAHGTVRVH
jgi:hypothetical protein